MVVTVVIPPTVDLAIVAVVPIPMATTHKAIIGVLVDHLKHPVALITIPTPMVATIIKTPMDPPTTVTPVDKAIIPLPLTIQECLHPDVNPSDCHTSLSPF